MDNIYVIAINDLLNRTYPGLAAAHKLEFKNFFGAVTGYIDGSIFIACGKFGTALKLPPQTLDELFTIVDVRRLRYFAKGTIKKEYAVLPSRILENGSQIKELLGESINFALSHSKAKL